MSAYILTFATSEATLETAGGKGANLVKLSQAGFSVPPGFIVSTQAYHDFVDAFQIQPRILALVQNLPIDQPDSVEDVSRAIYAMFDQAALPEELCRQILGAYHLLCDRDPAVAVRSSANVEDLPGFAFAGQQDTFLNVTGDLALLDAIKRCWASLWTARAITYRARNGFAQDAAALAVVIQRMVEADVSGVMFTANPITGKRQEIHIDASYGLGEALVSGQVEPDHYVYDPIQQKITEHRMGSKQVVISAMNGAGTQRMNRDPDGSQALPDVAIHELAQIGQRIAAYFGEPQDIEWAWREGRFFVLQSRPITSLYPLPEKAPADNALHIYFNFNAIQGVPDPLTPLGMDALRLVFSGVIHTLGVKQAAGQVFPDAGSRLFLDFGGLPGDPILQKFVLNFLESVEPGEGDILQQLLASGRVPSQNIMTPRLGLRLLHAFIPLMASTILRLLRYTTARAQVIQAGDGFVKRVQKRLAAMPGTAKEDLAVCLQFMQSDLPLAEQVSIRAMPVGLVANQLVGLLSRWLTRWIWEGADAAMPLLRSLPGNVTVEMNLRLWSIAQEIQADEPVAQFMRTQPAEVLAEMYHQNSLPEKAQHAIDRFLSQDGIRGVAEIDLGKPRWREDPTPIFRTLQGYLQLEDPELAPNRIYQRGLEQADQLMKTWTERIRNTRFGWLKSRLFLAVAYRVRGLASLRETPLFYLAQVFALYRQALLQVGSELIELGQLEQADDIFYVPFPELHAWSKTGSENLKTIAQDQRNTYIHEYRRRQMPRVMLSTGETFYYGAATEKTETQMVGVAVSPGLVEGTARVILDPRGAHLEPGEILVCPSTDPGWTPLFLTAGGLIMEIGGLMTHGSIVAREFGIPAVVGVRDATTRIITGQRIRVDGSHGWVLRLKE